MKQRQNFNLGVGTSSILMIFVVLCLTVFGVLSYTTARADERLTKKALEGTASYYAADALAEEALCEVDENLVELSGVSEKEYLTLAAQKLEASGFVADYAGGELTLVKRFPVREDVEYLLSVRVNPLGDSKGRYTVLARKVKNTAVWEEEILDLWDGD